MHKIPITTSWDDGHKLDLKMVKLLHKYGLPGTFYICPNHNPKNKTGRLSDDDIREIDKTQKIGAHTLNHYDLTQLDLAQVKKEIYGSKEYIENILQKNINSFAYPFGKYNPDVEQIAKQAGFSNIRTINPLRASSQISLQVYPFPLRKRSAQQYHLTRYLFQPLTNKSADILKLKLPLKSFLSWYNLAQSLFDYSLKHNKTFHLWGHSEEVERYSMWQDLEKIFKYIIQHN